MKKLLLGFCLVLFAAGIVAAQANPGGTMYVSVKTVTLKSGTGFFAGNRGELQYGDRVTVVRVDGRFVEVKNANNVTGWTPTANLSARQVITGTSSTATAREVALAGKGFNQEVETSYRAQGNLNYADVDRVEAITVNENDLRRFLEEGRLSMGEN
ncbi:MAG: SH3 domain-containing protein [Treponema sp.]|nr:SH3 domain-containing protein [Treponema sp.]MCL2251047.1 SH3 domain-containing protein [Treponema sp.]